MPITLWDQIITLLETTPESRTLAPHYLANHKNYTFTGVCYLGLERCLN